MQHYLLFLLSRDPSANRSTQALWFLWPILFSPTPDSLTATAVVLVTARLWRGEERATSTASACPSPHLDLSCSTHTVLASPFHLSPFSFLHFPGLFTIPQSPVPSAKAKHFWSGFFYGQDYQHVKTPIFNYSFLPAGVMDPCLFLLNPRGSTQFWQFWVLSSSFLYQDLIVSLSITLGGVVESASSSIAALVQPSNHCFSLPLSFISLVSTSFLHSSAKVFLERQLLMPRIPSIPNAP